MDLHLLPNYSPCCNAPYHDAGGNARNLFTCEKCLQQFYGIRTDDGRNIWARSTDCKTCAWPDTVEPSAVGEPFDSVHDFLYDVLGYYS